MSRIFGFDIGTTSIGFAVIDFDRNTASGKIVPGGLGVRIFPEARDFDGIPKNQLRRQKRSVRRQFRRRRQRRRALNEALCKVGLLPKYGSQEWRSLMSPNENDPYALRARGLTDKLTLLEVGRALYHLAKRRHFKGRDIEEADEEPGEHSTDELKAANDREATTKSLMETGQTLGEWLARKPAHERRRGVHALRTDVRYEFDRLWTAQAAHHPHVLTNQLRQTIEEIAFAQRPVFWRKSTLGRCLLMPDAPLAAKSSWASCQRRMLEQLNNLEIAGGNARALDEHERSSILALLQRQASMTWGGVRKAFEPIFNARGESARSVKFNLELSKSKALLGNPVEAKFASIFGPAWENMANRQAIRDQLPGALWAADYSELGQRVVIRPATERRARREDAAKAFATRFQVPVNQAEALAGLTFAPGWDAYSTEALARLLPELEKGARMGHLLAGPEYEDWRRVQFPNRRQATGESLDLLPSPACPLEQRRLNGLRNPTVTRVQNELRKVVNNLIRASGKPDVIRIELARDIGLSARERTEKNDGMRRRERERKNAREDLEAHGITEPSHDDIDKWLLWKECGERDPYSGDHIGFDALFRRGEFEVEHIWPRARSLDNSLRNKTLCRHDFNKRKAKRTPFEAFGQDKELWATICGRLDGMVGAKKVKPGLSPGKVKRFLAHAIPDDFASRQLNDTGFAARQAMASLKRLWPDTGSSAPVHVQAVSGKVTAHLRHLWGLNNILSEDGKKTRADHRHHAIDALVVACCDPGVTQRLSRYWQAKDNPEANVREPRLKPPWDGIRRNAEDAVNKIVVSHRVRKKVSGPLHAEMPFGFTGDEIVKNNATLGVYVKRMPVDRVTAEALKIESVEQITRTAKFVVRDAGVRTQLLAHLEKSGLPAGKSYPPYPRVSKTGPEIRKVRVLTTQQSQLMVPVANGYTDISTNHHIAVYRTDGGAIEFEVVSLFEAARRLARREPIVRRLRNGCSFIMSLAPGDTVEFPAGEKQGYWVVEGAWSNGQVVLNRVNDADNSSTYRPKASGMINAGARKVSVDPIGRARPAHD